MRKLALSIGLLTLVVLLLASGVSQARQTDPKAEAGLKKLMESYQAAVEKQDLVAIMKCFADGPDTVVMGTGPGELYVGKESIEKAHRAFFSNYVKETGQDYLDEKRGKRECGLACRHQPNYPNPKERKNAFDMNWSAFLEKQEDEWKIVAFHFSHLTGPDGQTPSAQGGAT